MSKWSEIRNDFVDSDNIMYFDGYLTDDDNEEGKVIATLNLNNMMLEYLDDDARTDELAQEWIDDAISCYYENRFVVWRCPNTKDWCLYDNSIGVDIIRDDTEKICVDFVKNLIKGNVTCLRLMPVGVTEKV